MKFQVQTGGRLQAVAHDGKPLGGESSFHFTFFRATVSSLDGKTLFTKVQASSENSKSEIRLLQMRQLMAQVVRGGVDYHFRLMVPRLHDKAATALVPTEEQNGMATRVRAPDGQELPFTTMKDVRAAWRHLATTATAPMPPPPPPTEAPPPPPRAEAPPPQPPQPPPPEAPAPEAPPPEEEAPPRPKDPVASFLSDPPTTFDPLPPSLPQSPVAMTIETEPQPEVPQVQPEPEPEPEVQRRLRPRRKRTRYT